MQGYKSIPWPVRKVNRNWRFTVDCLLLNLCVSNITLIVLVPVAITEPLQKSKVLVFFGHCQHLLCHITGN